MIEKNKKNIEIIVVIPVYNEGKSIYDLLCNINKVGVRNLALIIINDKSTDDSLDWINKFKNDNKGICLQVISHEDNLGLGGALNTGLTYCLKNYNFNILFTMDGDNTHDPSLIPNMINEINSGKDIVIASRYRPGAKVSGIPRHRIFLSYCARICYSIFWNLKGVRDYTCLFRAHTKSILDMAFPNKDEVILKEKDFLVTTEILRVIMKSGGVAFEVPIRINYSNKIEVSNMKIFKTIIRTFKVLLFK